MNKATVIECKHTAADRELTDTNLERMNLYFDYTVLPVQSHAVVHFSKDTSCVVPTPVAQQMAADLSQALPNKDYTLYSYARAEHPKVTVQILTHHEYRCHWLANYFNTSVDAIANLTQATPTVQANLQAPVDYTSPERHMLGNGFYADEDINPKNL